MGPLFLLSIMGSQDLTTFILIRAQPTRSVKGQTVTIIGLQSLDYLTLPSTSKGATGSVEQNECGCVPINLYFQKQVGSQLWPMVGCGLPILMEILGGGSLGWPRYEPKRRAWRCQRWRAVEVNG